MKQIGTLGTIDTLTAGGRVLTDLSNLITLNFFLGPGGDYSTGRLWNSTSGYQVTGGKTLTLVGGVWSVSTAAAGSGAVPLYADTDAGAVGAAPTNPVYAFGNNPGLGYGVFTTASAGVFGLAIAFSVPSGKFPAIFMTGVSTVLGHLQLYGYEV